MFMETLFVILSILLLSARNSERIVGQPTEISDLHQDDVDALNAMVRGLRMSNQHYSLTSCSGTTKGGSSDNIFCSCEFNNNTVCRVRFIDFSGRHLRGIIPSEVGNLIYLMGLDLSNNKIHGTIPNTLKNLSQLYYIYLDQNNLEGPIPDVFGDMKSLKEIYLSDNWFNGTIPPVFASLSVLQDLYLNNNLLSGGIPPELGNITSLLQLDLSDNRLSGELPQELGNLANVTSLFITGNELSGKLPQSFAALKNLVSLFLRGNNFSGKIPEYIDKWKKLKDLELMGNNFETPLPRALSSLNLSWLSVSDLLESNERRDLEFPDISRMTFLEHLTLRNCSINGPIPEFLGRMVSLRYLDLSFNNMTGDIPAFINDHQNLHHIYLKGNHLSGSVPAWLVDPTNSYVDISENNFTSIPVELGGNWTNVNSFACCKNSANQSTTWQRRDYYCHSSESLYDHLYINCGGDRMLSNGVYYEADSQPYGESTFFLSDDKNWGYSSMGTFLGTDHNRYIHKSSGIDASIYSTARVSPISLKYYGFCMKNGNYEVKLLFAEILYDENKDHSSKGKRYFDIKIQDKKVRENFNIKEAAVGKSARVPLAFNTTVKNHRLEIHLYWNGNGSIRSPMEYYGPLISGISVSPVHRKSGIKLSAVTVAALVGCAILSLALLIFVFLWKVGFLGGKQLRVEEQKGLELLPGGSFNFQQIKAATQNFNPLNKIGEGGFGSVYKGALPNGTPIAVKQLASKSKQGIREFVNELGTIFALQHPNLVKLLGCCTEDNQLVLVYEYMENNSLAYALFGPEELRLRLNWPTRFKICHGMAKGLAFLHEESKLKIVHRDIKPTNVLLDKDLNAKISDFGLAKLYETEHTHVITRIAGTTGYMAPEYAMRGYLTTKADVYSFGVVILEVVSGKSGTSYRPNDESVYLLDLAYVLQQKGDLISLVDPTLGSEYSLKQAMAILDLAMLCTNPSPTLRPTMSEVVKILEGKSKMQAHSFNVPYSTDDFAMAKAVAGLIPRTEFGSNSSGQTSNAITYDVVSREEEENGIFGDFSSEMQDKTQSLTKMAS